MKALVGAFNQEKALVGAFSVIVQRTSPINRFAALRRTVLELLGDIAEYSSFQDGIWSFWIEGVAVLFISIFGIFGKMDFSLYGIFPSFSFTARVKLIKQNVLRNKAS